MDPNIRHLCNMMATGARFPRRRWSAGETLYIFALSRILRDFRGIAREEAEAKADALLEELRAHAVRHPGRSWSELAALAE